MCSPIVQVNLHSSGCSCPDSVVGAVLGGGLGNLRDRLTILILKKISALAVVFDRTFVVMLKSFALILVNVPAVAFLEKTALL